MESPSGRIRTPASRRNHATGRRRPLRPRPASAPGPPSGGTPESVPRRGRCRTLRHPRIRRARRTPGTPRPRCAPFPRPLDTERQAADASARTQARAVGERASSVQWPMLPPAVDAKLENAPGIGRSRTVARRGVGAASVHRPRRGQRAPRAAGGRGPRERAASASWCWPTTASPRDTCGSIPPPDGRLGFVHLGGRWPTLLDGEPRTSGVFQENSLVQVGAVLLTVARRAMTAPPGVASPEEDEPPLATGTVLAERYRIHELAGPRRHGRRVPRRAPGARRTPSR